MARGGGRGGGGFGGSRGGGRSFGGSRGGGSRLGGGSARGRGPTRGSVGSNRNPSAGNYNRQRPRGGYYGGMGGLPSFLGGFGLGRGSRRRRRYNNRGGCSGCGGGGCLSSILMIVVILFVFNFIWGMIPGNNNNTAIESVQVNSSTIEREAIEKGLVNETAYYEDELGWIKNPNEIKKGMSYFYDKTNIQPFVYITDNIDGDPNPEPVEIDNFAAKIYDELFTDEAHLLLVHFENYDQYQYEYSYHTVYGSQAKVLMDDEAEGILFDYLDYHYGRDPNQVSEEQYFSESFKDTADRIMTVTRSPWIPVLLVIGVAVILLVLFNWWRSLLSKDKEKEKKINNNPEKPKNESNLDEFDF